MSLRGNLTTLPVPELLELISRTRKTGTLVLNSARASKRIFFAAGRIVSADSTDPNEMLGHYLIGRGLVGRQQVREALEIQERTNVFSGAALVKLGAIDEKELEAALRDKTVEIIYSMFDWHQGSFQFLPQERPPMQNLIPVQLEVGEVLWKGAVRQDELAQIREVFPNAEIVPRMLKEPPEHLVAEDLAQRVRDLVDGRRSFGEIQLGLHSSEYLVGRCLYAFFSEGCLAVMSPERAERMGGEAGRKAKSESGQLEEGDRCFREGRFADALDIYRQALDTGTDRADLQKLIQSSESLLMEEIHRQLLPPHAVLQKVWSSRQIMEGDFTPPEFFLIEQVNARWAIRDLVRLSPLPDVDALRVLRGLVERKVLKVLESWD